MTAGRAGAATRTAEAGAVPAREDWPAAPSQTDAGEALTEVILATLRLHGRLMDVARRRAEEGGITATEWQVLGGVLDAPRTVAAVGRLMGMTRQGVQRVADGLVERGLAEYRPNPAHRRSKLLTCTEAGYWAIRQITLVQRPWADEMGARIGAAPLRETLAAIRLIVDTLETEEVSGGD